MSEGSITMTIRAVNAVDASMTRLADSVRRFGAMIRRRHTQTNGRPCYIGHPLDKPCPKWRGRNYP